MKTQLLVILICGLLLAPAQPSWARKWTDNTGKFSVEAELVEVNGDQVVLKKTGGKEITLPITRLSVADRRYLQSLAQEPTNEPLRPAPEVIAAWEKVGAEFGWNSQIEYLIFVRVWQRKKPVAGDMPAFHFRLFPTGKLMALPPPKIPFGLSLFGESVTDAGLKELARLTQLQSLDLAGTKVTDAGLKELAGLKQLKSLDLHGAQVTDAGLKALTRLTQLQSLDLGGTKVTDAGLKELAGLKQLQYLNLFNTQVTNAGLKALTGLTQLQVLGLRDTQVTDAGLKELAGLTQLQFLSLRNTQVTDLGLKELARLTQLRLLSLYRTKVTDAGVQELQKALPKARITRLGLDDAGLNKLARATQSQSLDLGYAKVCRN